MKVKILLKNIKEGVSADGAPYCIKSLYACVRNKEDANTLALQAIADGVPKDKIQEVIKSKEYEGETSYAFGLNCSHFTFDRVDRFGVLDAKIEFVVNKKGFINARIQVIDRKEQVFGYEQSSLQEEEVDGWVTYAPDIKIQEPIGDGSLAEANPITPFGINPDPTGLDAINKLGTDPDDLPF